MQRIIIRKIIRRKNVLCLTIFQSHVTFYATDIQEFINSSGLTAVFVPCISRSTLHMLSWPYLGITAKTDKSGQHLYESFTENSTDVLLYMCIVPRCIDIWACLSRLANKPTIFLSQRISCWNDKENIAILVHGWLRSKALCICWERNLIQIFVQVKPTDC